jgi:PKD repeat protein
MAGGQLGRMIFYNIPSLVDSNLTADFNTAVAANQAKIINVSLGLCETDEKADGAAAAQDQILAQGVAQGQTFAVATGDAGANECDSAQIAPNWPSSSQYVIAVGGTDLSASTTTWEDETAWIDGGGGPSTFEPRPSWQVVEEGNEPTVLRGTPDLAFDADPGSGAIIVYKGLPTRFGGTSLSAPLFAGMWARVIRVKGTSAGFAGPLIYPIADDFHDIRVGNNGFYSAGLGYDYATGLGSLILNKAINDIPPLAVVPPVANFSFITSGLSVDFTDSSVSSKGTIVSNTWQFGDGGTSSVSAPSHTYAAAGTYKVTETVVDSLGHSSSKTQSVKVTTTVGTQLLQNTSFEDGVAPWSMQPDVIVPDFPVEAHSGTAFANIGQESLTEHVAQSVAIPAGKTSATLGFYMWVQTDETTTTKVDDKLDVEVYGSTGALLATLATYSNLDVSNAYVVHTFDMTPYIGQTVSIRFVGTNNATLPTYWLLDDVTLTVQ